MISEADRVLKPDGVLYLSTTNVLCPKQMEFELPLYSWYPGFVKRKVERLSVTSHPHLANHAKYPAVNWFLYGGLTHHLEAMGYKCCSPLRPVSPRGAGKLPALRCAGPATQACWAWQADPHRLHRALWRQSWAVSKSKLRPTCSIRRVSIWHDPPLGAARSLRSAAAGLRHDAPCAGMWVRSLIITAPRIMYR